jgi:hypothetical protein
MERVHIHRRISDVQDVFISYSRRSGFRAGDGYDGAGIADITKCFNTDYSTIQLTISGFLVIYAGSQLLSGFIGEKLGKLRVLTASFLLFPRRKHSLLYVRKFNDVTGWQSVTGRRRGAGPVSKR